MTTGVASVTDKPINGGNGVTQGLWYQLGVDATHKAGIRGIGTVVIKDGVTPQTVDVDYKLDAELGRIYIIPGGGIADTTVLTSDYDTTVVSWDDVATNSSGPRRGALRFTADNPKGANRDLFARNVTMSSNGDMAWKSSDTVQKMTFNVSIQKPADGSPAMHINGRPA